MKRRFLGLGGVLLAVSLATTAAPAVAKPPAKPTVSVPVVGGVTKPGAEYAVPATWTASSNAMSFAVKLVNASGVILDSGTVSTPSWTGHTTAPAGTVVRVTVRPRAGTRWGQERTSLSTTLPDLTAPLGTFSVVRDDTGGEVALHKDSLTDDVTSEAGITATVSWDSGTSPVEWQAPFGNLPHVYSEDPAVHYVTVTVSDQAGNSRTYPLTVVVNDTEAPNGSFTVSSANAWASWSKVSLQQVTVNDNLSLPTKITRLVNWGDGTAPQVWPQGAAASHMYTKAGTFTPKVTLTDEGGNQSTPLVTSWPVVVKVDSAAPALRLTPPRTRTKSVRSWRYLKGRASDAGVGVRNVLVKAVEKRGTSWYAYKPASRTWVKAGTKTRAWTKAGTASVKPTAAGAWSLRVARLTKGTLLYKARAYDNRANASGWVSKKAVLTRR